MKIYILFNWDKVWRNFIINSVWLTKEGAMEGIHGWAELLYMEKPTWVAMNVSFKLEEHEAK